MNALIFHRTLLNSSKYKKDLLLPFFFFLKIYLFIYSERARERQRQAEGEAGSVQEARHGTRSWVSRITPRAAGGAKPLRHWGCPCCFLCWTKYFYSLALALSIPFPLRSVLQISKLQWLCLLKHGSPTFSAFGGWFSIAVSLLLPQDYITHLVVEPHLHLVTSLGEVCPEHKWVGLVSINATLLFY